jgi:hypothetical protein
MAVNNRTQRVFNALVTLLLLSTTSVFAQHPNQIINGGFESNGGGAIYSTDYERTYGGVVEAGHYAVDYSTANYGGGGGWPEPAGSTGRFMMVNGFGGNNNPNKVVWSNYHQDHPYISVIPNTQYTFSCKVVNLNVVIQGQINPAKLQLKINGNNVGTVNQLPSSNDWRTWTVSWNSGNAEQAVIQIVDMYTGNSGLGDDYALDDMSFRLDAAYSLTASDFTETFCGEITPIDLTNHYNMTYPSGGNSAPPLQVKIRKNSSYPWETSITTNHGTAYVGSDNKIYYTPNEGYYGPDDFRYQISRFGLVSEKRIDVNVFSAPSNCTPQGLPANNLLCLSDVASFNPSATWESNGSTINPSGWLYKKIGVTDWQESYTFQNWVPQWGRTGEYSIKFFAENSCGRQESEPYNFNICDVPEWNQAPNATSICTGSAEPTVSINWNYNTGVQTWQYKRGNGNWTDFVWGAFDLLPGDQVRYRVTYDACSGNPLTSQTINVVSGPQFNSSIPVSFEEGYCPNSQVSLPQIQSSWYNTYGMSVTSGWYYVNYDPSGSPSYVPVTGSTIILNNGSVSVTPCLQNTECGFTPFFPAFDLVVWDEPAILGLDELPDSLGPVCSGTSLSSILPELSPDGHYTEFGWEISAGQNPSGYQSNLPQSLSASDNGRWLRYHVEGCPQFNAATSNPIRVWVGAAPALNTSQITPLGTVCEGTLVASLADVHVTNWNLFEGVEQWEVNLNGTWTAFTQFELNHNGCQVRYYAQNQCGETIVSAGVVSVTEGPSFNSPGASLGLEDYYCDGNSLNLPTPPGFDGHGINVNDEYWAYFDGVEYHRITSTPQLDESWNGYQITYVLESDCGGEIYYPTPFTLTVKGQPEVEISLDGSNTFCVGTPLSLDFDVDWHLCTQNTQASSWQYAPVNQPYSYSDFNPNVGIPEAGTFLVNYHAVANECGFDAYGTPLTVTIEAAPGFSNAVPFELDRFCEDDVLQIPSNPVVSGHVDESGWQISVGYDPDGEYTEIAPGHALTLSDNGRWLKYYAIGCNVYIHHEVEIYVDGKPLEEWNIANRICKGQYLSFQLISTNGYPVTQREWKIGSTSGNVFNPYEYTFDVEGEYLIYYRVGNDCGWSDYVGPLPLSVTAGPEFDNSTLPTESQYVCEGTTVGEFLQQTGITAPSLVDPSVPHHDPGWFINGQRIELTTVILEGFHGAVLCYGVEGECSDVPVFSSGFELHVYGYPEVMQMPQIDWEFCDGDAVQLPDPEIDFHNGEGLVDGSWQIQSADGTWEDLPTTWTANYNGAHLRYHLDHSVCLDLSNDSEEIVISVHSAPVIIDEDLPSNNLITICFGGSLGIDEPEVLPEQNESGWQVSANGTDWGTVLEGHAFDPNRVDAYFDGKYLRYHAESTQCPNLEDNSEVYTIQLMDSPTINDGAWPDQVSYCSGGSLGIETPDGLSGVWKVSENGTNWVTELEGHVFDPSRVDDFFDGKLLRYFVHTSCGDDESKVLTLRLLGAPNMPIVGETQVAMMNSFWTGIYDYHIDSTSLEQPVEWSLEGANWQLKPLGMARCLVYVSSIGTAVLHARISNELCSNEFEVVLPINSTYFGVEDNDVVEVMVYPNPARFSVTIEAEGIESVRLLNMMGQVLDLRECNGSDAVMLNLSGYSPAIYLLEINTMSGTVRKRLVVCR